MSKQVAAAKSSVRSTANKRISPKKRTVISIKEHQKIIAELLYKSDQRDELYPQMYQVPTDKAGCVNTSEPIDDRGLYERMTNNRLTLEVIFARLHHLVENVAEGPAVNAAKPSSPAPTSGLNDIANCIASYICDIEMNISRLEVLLGFGK